MSPAKRTLLFDIEGTTSPIAFVKNVLFLHARQALPAFVRARGQEPEVRRWLDAAATEAGGISSDNTLVEVLQGWIDEDRKHPALKALQGMLWREGYASGAYTAPVYADAVQGLRAWHAAGHPLHIYSSGSVDAQKQLFAHSDAGDLSGLFQRHFDATIGGKREAASYAAIVAALGVPAEHVTFFSDVVEELDAAREAGLATVLVDRREDYPRPREGTDTHGHPRVESFAEVDPDVTVPDPA